jgi:two-component sensor histidine kinase
MLMSKPMDLCSASPCGVAIVVCAGPIKVSFISGTDGEYELCVLDEGEGLPEGFAVDRPRGGLGIKLVAALTGQLAGQLCASPNPAGRGSCFTVTFPINEQGHRD